MQQDISVYAAVPFEHEVVNREEYERCKDALPSYDAFLADFRQLNLIIRHLSLQDKGESVILKERMNLKEDGLLENT